MPQPLVSVILTSYNRPEMFRKALLSIVNQTYRELQIVVQDDSTNEAAGEVVAGVGDPRVVYTRNKPSLGTAVNTVGGYRKSAGRYFCTLNDDDWYAPEYIAEMVAGMEANQECGMAFCDHYLVDGEGGVLEAETEANTKQWGRDRLADGVVRETLEMGLVTNSVPAMFAMVRRDAVDLEDYPEETSSGYDYWLIYLALREGRPVFYSSRRLTYCRVHAGSQTASFADAEKQIRFARYVRFMYARVLADPRTKSVHGKLRPMLAQAYYSEGFSRLRLSQRGEAWRQLWAACRIHASKQSVIGVGLCLLPMGAAQAVLRRVQKR